jgi:hypothetical protein
MAQAVPDYRYAYETHPESGVVYRQLLHDIDAREAATKFPKRWSLVPPLDGKFVDKPTPQSAATDKPATPPEMSEEEKKEAWRKQWQEEMDRDRQAAEDRAQATAAARAATGPDAPPPGPPSVDRPIDKPDGVGEFKDRSGPAVLMAERGEDPGLPPVADPNDATPRPTERPDNSKSPPDLQADLGADLSGKGKRKS